MPAKKAAQPKPDTRPTTQAQRAEHRREARKVRLLADLAALVNDPGWNNHAFGALDSAIQVHAVSLLALLNFERGDGP